MSQIITDHAGSVNCVAALERLLVTGGSDGNVNIYNLDSSGQYTLNQTIRLAPFYPLTLSLQSTKNRTLLAIGGSSSKIHLYALSTNEPSFTTVATLKGHEDWIRGLDFAVSNTDIYLASASQDRYIRLWKITQSATTDLENDTDAMYKPLSKQNLTS